jgi:hypothetical protein
MAIRNEPHCEIASGELARWLELQGTDRWWSVDGDPVLGGRLSIPCPADEPAAELRQLNRPLLVAEKEDASEGRGQTIRAEDLDRLVDRLEYFGQGRTWTDRALYLCWKGSDVDWLLVEDAQTTESEAREARSQQKGR